MQIIKANPDFPTERTKAFVNETLAGADPLPDGFDPHWATVALADIEELYAHTGADGSEMVALNIRGRGAAEIVGINLRSFNMAREGHTFKMPHIGEVYVEPDPDRVEVAGAKLAEAREELAAVTAVRTKFNGNYKAMRRLQELEDTLGRGAAMLLISLGVVSVGPATYVGLYEATHITGTTTEQVFVPHNTQSTKTVSVPDSSSNPFSPNFRLTGQEEARDRGALKYLLGTLSSNQTITSVKVTGYSSPEAAGQIITASTPETSDAYKSDHNLAVLRAKAGEAALKEVAGDHIKLPGHITIEGKVYLADQNDLLELNMAATNLNMSVDNMIELYDQGKLPNIDLATKGYLDDVLAKHREVTYTIGIETHSTKTTEREVTKHNFFDEFGDWKTILLVSGMTGGLAGFSALLKLDSVHRKLAKYRVNRELQRQSAGEAPSRYYERVLRRVERRVKKMKLDTVGYPIPTKDFTSF